MKAAIGKMQIAAGWAAGCVLLCAFLIWLASGNGFLF